jgi:N-acetylneuraminate lyase
MEHYRGIIPAAYTPFSQNGDLDLGPVPELAGLFRSQNLPAVFICGSTGESHSLTIAERRLLAQAWSRETREGFDLIVHVGCNSQVDAVELAQHARSVGATAIASFAPSYYRPETIADLVAWLEPIASAAPDIPFYFYDIPELTGVRFEMGGFLRDAVDRIPNLAGLKFTSTDLMRLQTCLDLDDARFDILFGTDEVLLAGLALGVKGGVGSTYNYAAPLYRRLIDAFESGDLPAARREQRKSVLLVEALHEHGVLRGGKAIMSLLGINCGPVRPPFQPVDAKELARIYQAISHLDVFPRPLQLPRGQVL